MSIINGLRKMKAWEWILIFIFLATIFLFRFKYMIAEGAGLVRINRITGVAKGYIFDDASGKFKFAKREEYSYNKKYNYGKLEDIWEKKKKLEIEDVMGKEKEK